MVFSVDAAFADMSAALGHPPVFFVDTWPVLGFPMAIVTNHDVAEQISRATKHLPDSVPKSPTFDEFEPLLGKRSLLTKHVRLPDTSFFPPPTFQT